MEIEKYLMNCSLMGFVFHHTSCSIYSSHVVARKKNHQQQHYLRRYIYIERDREKMLDKIWDDVMAGPQPQRGLGKFRKLYVTTPDTAGSGEESGKYVRSLSMPSTPEAPATPTTPTTPSPSAPRKDNVWRSVFNPGSNLASRSMGSQVFDKPNPNTPTVYDWLYSGETKSKNHH
ncbi:hypothetical protein AgCh_025409 [Apium graveolens]